MDSHCFRFFATKIKKDIWEITGEEFKHLYRTLKLSINNQVEVFDGKGNWGKGPIIEIKEKKLAVIKTPISYYDQIPIHTFSIAIGALKQTTSQELLPYLNELGVNEIHMFLHIGVHRKRLCEKTKLRFQRILVASSKQCKRSRVPKLFFWDNLKDFISYSEDNFQHKFLLLKNGSSLKTKNNLQKNICFVIGGEKGLNKDEETLLIDSNFHSISIGTQTLRAITASISAASLMCHLQSDL